MTRTTLMTRSVAVLAMAGALAAQTAAAQTAACLSNSQAQSLAVAALPDALSSARRACLPHLPAASALTRSSTKISQVYQPAADRAWPVAGRAFLAAVELPLPPGSDPQIFRPLLTAAITALVEQEIKPENCNAVEEFYSALEPLPPENMGKLLIALMKLDETSKKPGEPSKNPFTLCKDSAK
ncbi:MAG: hypothetical protein ACT6R2_05735 [Blastomonas fulva]|nr:hypothetical protein [Blastomonas fulva]